MKNTAKSPLTQSLRILLVISGIVFTGFGFAYFQHEDSTNRVSFALTGTSGAEVTQKDMGGKWMLLYFGFTSCPDICPTQTAKVAQTLRLLDKKRLGDTIAPVFVSVDYVRDTPEGINSYLQRFDQRLIGLTGNPQQLDQVVSSFDTHYEVQRSQHAHHGDINVIHSSMTYLVDPFGKIVDQIAYGYDPAFLADHIEKLL